MAVNSGDESQGASGFLMICNGGNNIPERESHSSEVSCLKITQTCYDDSSKCQNLAYVKLDVVDDYALFDPNSFVEKGKLDIPKPTDQTSQNSTSEYSLTHLQRALQREISLHVGDKFMKLLMNNSLELPKFMSREKSITDRVYDTPTSRSRKYKRSVSFNARRVGLLFSVLSIMGTMILIYLTIRVRQIGEVSANL